MISVGVEVIGYILLPLITWIIAHHVGYSLAVEDSHLMAMLLIVIVSPILEEVIFRGMLQEWLLNRFRQNIWLIFAILNLGFALVHYRINTNLCYLIAIFICGMIFSRLKMRFGNLGYSIGMHIYYNAVFWVSNT